MLDTTAPIETLAKRGVSRRDFLKMCELMAATLLLPLKSVEQIADALSSAIRTPVIWLEFQDCTGDTESFLRACRQPDPLQAGVTDPSITELLLDVLSVDYHETIMAPSGFLAEQSRANTLANYAGQYIVVVEGSIPTGGNGVYCTIGGRTAQSIFQEVIAHAKFVIAYGSCAWDGGLAGALPNPTGALGVKDLAPGLTNLVNIPGCPANVVNLVATIVYALTYNALPPLTSSRTPVFSHGRKIHSNCEREDFFDQGQYVLQWGDVGHRNGWCLRKMGCVGPETSHNCARVKWNEGTCWPIGAGHGCVGCASSKFWDTKTPFYTVRSGD